MPFDNDFSKGDIPRGRGDSCVLDFGGPPKARRDDVLVTDRDGAKASLAWFSSMMAAHERNAGRAIVNDNDAGGLS